MNGMFGGCKSLTSLPDMSKWNTSKVVDMRFMFLGCKSLKAKPDISKWDMRNVKEKKMMFDYSDK